MAGVFLSYSRADRAIADLIIRGLRAVGVDAWWDEDMRGVDWQKELEERIGELGGVMVLWTPNSINSNHVRDEARLALDTDKLINVLSGVPKPPFPYDRVNGLPLDSWTGREPHRGWTRLIETIDEMFAASGAVAPGDFIAALSQREQAVHDKQDAIAQAQEAFQEAQGRVAEADQAAKAASASLTRAEEELSRAAEQRFGPAILRSAQQQLDAALAAHEAASAAERPARAELSEASKAVSRATADLERLFAATLTPATARTPTAAVEPVDHGSGLAALDRDESVETSPPAAEPSSPAADPPPATTSTFQPAPKAPPARISVPPVAWIAASGVIAVVGIGALLMWRHPGQPTSPASPASAAAAAATPAVTVTDSTARALAAAAALRGAWADAASGCPGDYSITVRAGLVSLTASGATSTATIDRSPRPGVISAHGDDGGYTYTLDGDELSVAGPGGVNMRLIRCAG